MGVLVTAARAPRVLRSYKDSGTYLLTRQSVDQIQALLDEHIVQTTPRDPNWTHAFPARTAGGSLRYSIRQFL